MLGADNVDEPGGYVGDIGDDDDGDEIKDGGGWAGVKKAEPAEQILLVKRKGNLAGQNPSVKVVCKNGARASRALRNAQGRHGHVYLLGSPQGLCEFLDVCPDVANRKEGERGSKKYSDDQHRRSIALRSPSQMGSGRGAR